MPTTVTSTTAASNPATTGRRFTHLSMRSVDPTGRVKETTEDNNTLTNGPFTTCLLADLVVAALTQNSVTVTNQGVGASGPSLVAIEGVGTFSIRSLLVGESDIPDVHAQSGAIEAAVAGARRTVVPKAGHLVYLELPDVIWIAAVAHGSRKPGYWLHRMIEDEPEGEGA